MHKVPCQPGDRDVHGRQDTSKPSRYRDSVPTKGGVLRPDATVLPKRIYGFASVLPYETSVKLTRLSLQYVNLSPRVSLFVCSFLMISARDRDSINSWVPSRTHGIHVRQDDDNNKAKRPENQGLGEAKGNNL